MTIPTPIVQARPGTLIVERLEMPIQRGRLHIPDSYNRYTMSNEAVVVSCGEGCTLFPVGTHVFLAPSVARFFQIDDHNQRRTYYLCAEAEIMATLPPTASLGPVDLEGPSPRHLMTDDGTLQEIRESGNPVFAEGVETGKR